MRYKKYFYYKGVFIAPYVLRVVSTVLLIMAIWERDLVGVIACVLTIIVSFIPTVLERDFKITLPWSLDLLMASALLLHVGGNTLKAYYLIPGYDTITHFVSSIFISFLAFVVIFILDKYWDGLLMDTYALAFVVVIFTMAMGVVWELFEWGIDLLFGIELQWGLQDTMKDLLVDTVAGIIMAVFGVYLVKRGSFDEITKEFGEDLDQTL
ncbi:MAG: hypothetical protein SVJ22_11795, partial [Halobacteriota archaeon]|nr:hypothetical protein [Halobacteriota archaeon]